MNDIVYSLFASIAQLGERKTEDLEAPCSIHGRSNMFCGIQIFLSFHVEV